MDGDQKRNRLVSECPVCSGQLMVTRLRCGNCETELSGQFSPNEFARLPQDKLDFLRTFIDCRGNLKLVEGVLGLSYPTVRARLDGLLATLRLGIAGAKVAPGVDQAAVLEALDRGEITLEEAEIRLRGDE